MNSNFFLFSESEKEAARRKVECDRLKEEQSFSRIKDDDTQWQNKNKVLDLEHNLRALHNENQSLRQEALLAKEAAATYFNSETLTSIKQLQQNLKFEQEKIRELELENRGLRDQMHEYEARPKFDEIHATRNVLLELPVFAESCFIIQRILYMKHQPLLAI